MKALVFFLSVSLLTQGCETVYHHNTVYQHDAAPVEEDSEPFGYIFDTGLSSGFKANNCSTDHYGDLKPYNIRPRHCEIYDSGYCCAWVTEFSSEHVCMEEWCYWEDTCDWDLNGWGEECFLTDGGKDGQSK